MPKSGVIAALVAALALGTVMGAFAQKPSTETVAVETATIVEVAVWQRASDGALYLSTRPEGGGRPGGDQEPAPGRSIAPDATGSATREVPPQFARR